MILRKYCIIYCKQIFVCSHVEVRDLPSRFSRSLLSVPKACPSKTYSICFFFRELVKSLILYDFFLYETASECIILPKVSGVINIKIRRLINLQTKIMFMELLAKLCVISFKKKCPSGLSCLVILYLQCLRASVELPAKHFSATDSANQNRNFSELTSHAYINWETYDDLRLHETNLQ